MADLKSFYMGYELKNPIVLASCALGKKVENLCQAEENGVAAVVLPSLFEEVIKNKMGAVSDTFHPEAYDYGIDILSYGASKYVEIIKEAKKRVKIPIFASVNCIDSELWLDFAKSIEDAGADGLELNISYISFNINDDPRAIEDTYVEIVNKVKNRLNIPISVKIGSYFSSIPNMVKRLKDAGADAVVIFNRYYQVNYDYVEKKFVPVNYFSNDKECYNVMRWIGVIYSQLDIDVAATTGFHTAKQIVDALFMGASVVQLATIFYKKGLAYAKELINNLNNILDDLNVESLKDIKGKAVDSFDELKALERVQYMEYLDKAAKG
ncbi:dihydroorotate dehydrogenase-like protein [Deferribacter thermophilus]|uniref:dihydroorotate dehydrogenase-like protein n=1 Tax=Deferribacter thermophilus TaxID=53573 RepID=UPI003C21C91A